MKNPAEIIAALTTACASAASLLAYGRIEPGARIAVHWNIEGNVDRFAGRLEATVLLPAIMLMLAAALLVLGRRRAGLKARRENPSAWLAGCAGGFLVVMTAHLSILWNAVFATPGMAGLTPVLAVVSLVLIWLGNTLPKTRPNPFVGVRTASTLGDRGAWGASNRFAGWTFVMTGVLSLGIVLAGDLQLAAITLLSGVLAGALLAILIGQPTRPR